MINNFINKFHLEEPDKFNILKQIPNDSIDLIVTSPPYNVGIKYDVADDKKSWDRYWDWNKEWLLECYRILKDDGRICVNHYLVIGSGNKDGTRQLPVVKYYEIMTDIGYKYNSMAIWTDTTIAKLTSWGSWMSSSAPYISTPYEGVFIFYKNQWKKQNKGKSTITKEEFMKAVTGSWDIGTDKKQLTMATFPEKLPQYCINLLSYEGDTVLDPFAGSGTTCVVAKRLNRNWIGLDISQEYIDIAENRMKEETKKIEAKTFENNLF